MAKKNRVAVVGVGYSDIARDTGLSYQQIMTQSALRACDDAGMKIKDVDGLTLYALGEPESSGELADKAINDRNAPHMLGMSPVNWFSSARSNFGDLAGMAIAGVAAGFCHTAIAIHPCKTMRKGGGGGSPSMRTGSTFPGDQQFTQPFGPPGPGIMAGLIMQRHMAMYGTKEEHFGMQQVSQRYNASLNEDAFFKKPITLDDYLNSRWVSKPVRLLDCDYPCDMSGAVIFTTEERARDWKQKPVYVEAAAMSCISPTWETMEDQLHDSTVNCGKQLWSRTDLKPKDVDVANVYDGFSIITLTWLESLGFCKRGEAGPFIASGATRLGGSLPVNTDGGVCNVGRRHGVSHCIESVRQLRGDCGARQVPNAEVAIWSVAVGPHGSAYLMTK